MNTSLNRRHFLRWTGALIALPTLESIGFRRFTSAEASVLSVPSKRAVFLGVGFGVTKETWYPDPTDRGPDYHLSPGLRPLARHKPDFTVEQGC